MPQATEPDRGYLREMRSFLLLLLLPACTTIHSVGGGARAGEFYAVAETKGES